MRILGARTFPSRCSTKTADLIYPTISSSSTATLSSGYIAFLAEGRLLAMIIVFASAPLFTNDAVSYAFSNAMVIRRTLTFVRSKVAVFCFLTICTVAVATAATDIVAATQISINSVRAKIISVTSDIKNRLFSASIRV